jgi:hypothetical protein
MDLFAVSVIYDGDSLTATLKKGSSTIATESGTKS